MTLAKIVSNYENFARRLAMKAGAWVDALVSRRHVRVERSDFVLGAEGIPAPVPARVPGLRR